MIVELIASGVANALARLEQEQAAIKARVQFEQFFTPELARELAEHPDLLLGREAEVTLMFCDIRGFSAVSHRIGPRQTMAWINDVFETLSQCVVDQRGVLVDYIGDQLMAMWGAPEKCPDHAARACEAARGMVRELAKIDEQWETKVGQKTQVGIGINTGNAHVGNTGSQRKFKYGPLGNTVNLASRVQGATKMVKCAVMITENTHAQIGEESDTRRLCQVKVINIPHPVELFELAVDPAENWGQLAATYETALDCFHKCDYRTAVERLGNLILEHPDDGPTLVLLSRVVSAMTNGPQEAHPVWVFDQK
jgi:adenylate cyclase